MRRERHRPLDFLGSCRHQKLLRSLSRHYMTLIQTLLNLCPHSSIPLYTSNQTHPNARCWIRQSLLLIKNLIVVCLSWFCHLRVLPSVNLHRSCPHARNLRLHSRLRASPPCPPRCVSSTRSPSHQSSLIAPPPLACPNLAATLLAQCDRATAPPDAPRTMCSPWQSMAPSAIAAQICLTHEGEDRIRSTMATRNRLCAMDLYEVLLTTRSARRASMPSIYRCGSGGTSLCSATRSSEGGGARGAPDRRGGRGRGHGRTLERTGSASMRWGVRRRCSSPPPPSSS
jgi:hypothetical protein